MLKKLTTAERNSGNIIIILFLACGLTLCLGLTEADAVTSLPRPEKLSYRVQSDFLTISWEGVKGAAGYRLYISDRPNSPHKGTLDVGPLTELGPIDIHLLPEGRTFFLTVTAYDAEGESGKSPEVAVKLPYAEPGEADLSRIVGLLFDNLPGSFSGISFGTALHICSLIDPDLCFSYFALIRPKLITRLPKGLFIDYRDGLLGKDGHFHTGSALFSLSNLSSFLGQTSAGYTAVADKVYIDGTYLADGSIFGSMSLDQRAGSVAASLTLKGVFYTRPGPLLLDGEVFFDTIICRDYPVSGYVKAIYESGAEEVITFSGSCDGTYNHKMDLVEE